MCFQQKRPKCLRLNGFRCLPSGRGIPQPEGRLNLRLKCNLYTIDFPFSL